MFNENYGMYSGYEVENEKETKNMFKKSNSYGSMDYGMGCGMNMIPGIVCPPIYECPEERCIHREIMHEVPHICPINTRIINHHIYRHTYSPCYTCTEENDVSNVMDGCSCNF